MDDDEFVRQILDTPELKVTGLHQKSQALVNDLLQSLRGETLGKKPDTRGWETIALASPGGDHTHCPQSGTQGLTL